MARPKLDPKRSRTLVLPPLRVSQSENDCIRARAKEAGLTLSEFQRRACTHNVIKVKDAGFRVNVITLRDLGIVSNNLNQLTRMQHISPHFDEERIKGMFDAIEAITIKILHAD